VTVMKQGADIDDRLLRRWFQAPAGELGPLFKLARRLTDAHFGRRVQLFAPGKRFPSISITGPRCQLGCLHCGGHFLRHMRPLTDPESLLAFCLQLAAGGGRGCLISGGCDGQGRVPLGPFLPALTQIKRTTELFINVHTGLLSREEAQRLAETGIDCASVDVVGDDETIHQVYGLRGYTTADYKSTLQALDTHGVSVAPHICVGLRFGRLSGELAALQLIRASLSPSVLVIIALMPTEGTAMATVQPPANHDIARVCALARLLFPETEIALGCMRPRGAQRREMERLAVEAGVTRIALPTQSTIGYLKEKRYTSTMLEACCVVPPS